jgi:hypothetical protein
MTFFITETAMDVFLNHGIIQRKNTLTIGIELSDNGAVCNETRKSKDEKQLAHNHFSTI